MTRIASRRSMLRMAGLAAGVAAFEGTRPARAAAGEPLIVGEENSGDGKATTLSSSGEPTMILEAGRVGIGGRGTALRTRGSVEVLDGTITMVTRRRQNMYVQARENAITAVTTYRLAKESTIAAEHHGGGSALAGFSETKNWYGTGVYSWGTLGVRPGCGIAVVPKGDDHVEVAFAKNITLGDESIVLATPQAGAEVAVKRAHFVDEKTLRITLTEPAPAPTKVGYLVVKWT